MNLEAYGWNKADFTMAEKLTAYTHNPSEVFPYPIEALDENLTKIPGIKNAYISGYAEPTLLTSTISGLGGFVIEREDKNIGKGYVFEFIMNDIGSVYYRGITKPYPGHHFDPLSGISLATLFSNLSQS
jgi:hypothetical protein